MVTGEPLSDNLTHLAVVAVWAVVGIVLAIRGFSWDAQAGLSAARRPGALSPRC